MISQQIYLLMMELLIINGTKCCVKHTQLFSTQQNYTHSYLGSLCRDHHLVKATGLNIVFCMTGQKLFTVDTNICYQRYISCQKLVDDASAVSITTCCCPEQFIIHRVQHLKKNSVRHFHN